MTHTLTSMVVLLVMGADPPSDNPTWYVRGDTWQESLIQSREALMRHEAAAATAAGTTPAPRLGPWCCLGPVSVSDKSVNIETRILTDKKPNLDTVYAVGPKDAKQRWVFRLDYRDGWVHRLHSGEHVAYLHRNITSAASVTLPVYLDVMGEMAVWLNGEQVTARRSGHIAYNVWSDDVQVKPTPVQLELRAGDNDLLLKVELHPTPRPRDDQDRKRPG